jgi:hypothetical protein
MGVAPYKAVRDLKYAVSTRQGVIPKVLARDLGASQHFYHEIPREYASG